MLICRQRSRDVIVTKDDDVVVHQLLEGGPAVVWIRIGNTRKADLLGPIETRALSRRRT